MAMKKNRFARLWCHLVTGPWSVSRCFPASTLRAIEEAVKRCERLHPGEIRFAIEAALPFDDVLRGMTPRKRAIEVFSSLRVWDTEHNNGVLIYVLLADRDVEIVADRSVARGRVAQSQWETCCQLLEQHFRAGQFEQGAIAGIEAVAAVLAQHPPERPDFGNELPDAPALL